MSGLDGVAASISPACSGQDNAKPLGKAAEALFNGQHREMVNLGQELANLYDGRLFNEKARTLIKAAIDRNRRSIGFLVEAGGLPCYREIDRRDPFKIDNLAVMMRLTRFFGFEIILVGRG